MPDYERLGVRLSFAVGGVLVGVALWVVTANVVSGWLPNEVAYEYTTGILIPPVIVAVVPQSSIFEYGVWRQEHSVIRIGIQLLTVLAAATIIGILTVLGLQMVGLTGRFILITPIVSGFAIGWVVFLRLNREYLDREQLVEASTVSV